MGVSELTLHQLHSALANTMKVKKRSALLDYYLYGMLFKRVKHCLSGGCGTWKNIKI